jgi:nitrogen regulatory protein P-II 1
VRILLVAALSGRRWATYSRTSNEVTMELLVLVIDRGDKLDSILSGFIELGVTGATIIESQGMVRELTKESASTPVFAGLQDLIANSRPQSSTVFSVIETREKLDAAIQMIKDKCGDMTNPGTGILFTIPINRAVGLASALGSESA